MYTKLIATSRVKQFIISNSAEKHWKDLDKVQTQAAKCCKGLMKWPDTKQKFYKAGLYSIKSRTVYILNKFI